MRPVLLTIPMTPLVSGLLLLATLVWSALLARHYSGAGWKPAFRRAFESLFTFGSKGNDEKADLSVSGSLGTVILAAAIYGVVRQPLQLPVFSYAAMAFLGFAFTAAAGWRTGPKVGVPPETAIKVAFLCAFFGILGARAFFVAEFWDKGFRDQPARARLGRIQPKAGEDLTVHTPRGDARAVFKGDEKTPSDVVHALAALSNAGVTAKVIEVERNLGHGDTIIPRGVQLETEEQGQTVFLDVGGTALHAPPTHAEGYTAPWWEIFAIWHGGLVWYGGMIFGTAAVLIFARLSGMRIAGVADLASSCGALGVAFGRMGCFLNGCCWGRPSDQPWAIRFGLFSPAWIQHAQNVLGADWDPVLDGRQMTPELEAALTASPTPQLCTGSLPIHPVQVYAIVIDLIVFGIMYTFAMRRAKREWQTFCLWFINYAIIRFIIEHFRGDS
ncbi:MAG TPA: prolipoprotein diacylglyceryl transferase family protein, partial [Planctomycetota bacterium]|nr:prolipoprotein diacylglyceryl transferase family protein [Planctomycetota bacterium]